MEGYRQAATTDRKVRRNVDLLATIPCHSDGDAGLVTLWNANSNQCCRDLLHVTVELLFEWFIIL